MLIIVNIVFFIIGVVGVAYCTYKNVIEKKQQEESGKEVKQKVDLTLFFCSFHGRTYYGMDRTSIVTTYQ